MRSILVLIIAFLSFTANSQERCATMQLPQNLNREESAQQFETWLKQAKNERLSQRALTLQQAIYQIPVVFHVIHSGSNEGFGTNINEERIFEQIEILNQDFRRTNPDADDTPSQFRNVASDTEIEFVLAKQDPEGLPTNGIVRIKGSKDVYEPSDDRILMAESYWPHHEYLNIYVTDLSGSNLGFAQFPFSNLPGIATEFENYAITDGVVLDYKWVGINESTGSFDSYGRTATHEIGHYLGLRHIWGDGGCGFDDFCSDTPLADSSNSGCSTNAVSCDTKDMIQNYMDYTDDVCMNLFTVCQRERMRTVLEQSPRRRSLLTSHALEDPMLFTNDLGLRSVVSPIQADCSSDVTPRVEVRNYGSNNITSFRINFLLNSTLIESKESNIPLTTSETAVISFAPIAINASQANEIEFTVEGVNGLVDNNATNNTICKTVSPFTETNTPYTEDFETNQNYFRTTETGDESTWTFQTAPYITTENIAAMAPFYNQQVNFGDRDMLLTQTLDLTTLTSADLSFKYAYAPRRIDGTNNYYLDGLIIAVSTDCGASYPIDQIVFERYGSSLGTVNPSDDSFDPISRTSWDEITLNITRFAREPQVQIAIIGVNGGGNNIFVDDLTVSSGKRLAYDVGIKELRNTPVVSCDLISRPILEIKNYGYQTIDHLTLQITGNKTTNSLVLDDLDLASGDSDEFTLDISEYLQTGLNEFYLEIDQVDDMNDERKSNNSQLFYTLIDYSEDIFPTQEDFSNQDWITFSPSGTNQFKTMSIRGDTVLYTDNYTSTELTQSYLVSPSLQTNDLTEASMQFKYSYAQRLGRNDELRVLLSLNCGRTFDIELERFNAEQLAIVNSSSEWQPQSKEDWKSQYIDLTEYINYQELRIAFVFSNGNGNRLFIDDINLYTTNDPAIPDLDALVTTMAVFPNPATDQFSVAFNFSQRQQLSIQLADMSGRIVFKELYNNILNDKITFVTPAQSGFYILNITGGDINQSKRIYIR